MWDTISSSFWMPLNAIASSINPMLGYHDLITVYAYTSSPPSRVVLYPRSVNLTKWVLQRKEMAKVDEQQAFTEACAMCNYGTYLAFTGSCTMRNYGNYLAFTFLQNV